MTLKKSHKRILIILRDLLILVLIGNVLSIFTVPGDQWSLEVVLRNSMFSMIIGFPAWRGMNSIVLVLERRFPWLKYPVKRLIAQVAALSIFAGILMVVTLTLWMKLTEDIGFVAVMKLVVPSLKVAFIFMFLSLVIGNSVLFFKNWREATIQQEELKRAHLALQYQSLKDQVRPHFLFNSLSSLVTLINTDSGKATQFVHKLSDVYRYVLEQRENELVPLAEEVKFLEDYIYLQKIRFGESLQVHFKIDPDRKLMMIPLSLQMIVENAIKHNEVSADNPLVIDVVSTEMNQVVISNNLQKIEATEKSPGTGIENLQKRIAFFTDKPLVIEDGPEAFIVTIPTILS